MKNLNLGCALLFAASLSITHGQTVYQLNAIDYVFEPDTINAVVGDIIHLTLTSSEHTFTEVSEASWLANDNTWNGGLAYGPGTPDPGTHFVFTLNTIGSIWYVCDPHAAMGMKGIINVADISNAVTEKRLSDPYRLYPNPASDEVTVIAPSSASTVFVQVVDAQGREVINTSSTGITTLDTSALGSGSYIVAWTDGYGVPIAHERLMILR